MQLPNNVLERMAASLLGSGSGGVVDVAANMLEGLKRTYAELCKISLFLKPPNQYKAFAKTATGTAGLYNDADKLTIGFHSQRIDITLFDNNAFVQMGQRPAQLESEFELIAPGFYSLPMSCQFLQIRAVSGGSAPRYSVVAWN